MGCDELARREPDGAAEGARTATSTLIDATRLAVVTAQARTWRTRGRARGSARDERRDDRRRAHHGAAHTTSGALGTTEPGCAWSGAASRRTAPNCPLSGMSASDLLQADVGAVRLHAE